MEQAKIAPVQSKFVKKPEEKKQIKYPRYHNDSLRAIIADLKMDNAMLRKKLENVEKMYKILEKENLDIKQHFMVLREIDILGDEYFLNNPENDIQIESN